MALRGCPQGGVACGEAQGAARYGFRESCNVEKARDKISVCLVQNKFLKCTDYLVAGTQVEAGEIANKQTDISNAGVSTITCRYQWGGLNYHLYTYKSSIMSTPHWDK